MHLSGNINVCHLSGSKASPLRTGSSLNSMPMFISLGEGVALEIAVNLRVRCQLNLQVLEKYFPTETEGLDKKVM